jgi:hypothetical protein
MEQICQKIMDAGCEQIPVSQLNLPSRILGYINLGLGQGWLTLGPKSATGERLLTLMRPPVVQDRVRKYVTGPARQARLVNKLATDAEILQGLSVPGLAHRIRASVLEEPSQIVDSPPGRPTTTFFWSELRELACLWWIWSHQKRGVHGHAADPNSVALARLLGYQNVTPGKNIGVTWIMYLASQGYIVRRYSGGDREVWLTAIGKERLLELLATYVNVPDP